MTTRDEWPRLERLWIRDHDGPEATMRVIDMNSDETLQAASDEDLVKVVADWLRERGERPPEEETRSLIAEHAYDATVS